MRKQLMIIYLVSIFLILTGCGETPNWAAKLHISDSLTPEQPLPVKLEITDNGKPVTDVEASAVMEMVKMNHGSVAVRFTHQANGVYAANAALPMPGEWTAVIQMKNGNQSKEQMIPFAVK